MARAARRATTIVVRELDAVRVVFFNHETIYVLDRATERWHCFHRWFGGSGSYVNGWKPFRHLMFYERGLDIAHCYRLAFRYEINSQVARAGPNLDGRAVDIRESRSSKSEH